MLVTNCLSINEIETELKNLGFSFDGPNKNVVCTHCDDLVFYLKQKSKSYVLVISPRYEDKLGILTSISGVRTHKKYHYNNSNLILFPKHINNGKEEVHFGLAFDFETVTSLKTFVQQLRSKSQLCEPKSFAKESVADVDPRTETEAVRAARLGQQKFRDALLERWRGKCALTGVAMPEMLRASHIKPWCDSNSRERLDPDNGLLLAVHVDCLFDRGFISFDDSGHILISSTLDSNSRSAFGLLETLQITGLTPGNRSFLRTHRVLHFPAIVDQTDARAWTYKMLGVISWL